MLENITSQINGLAMIVMLVAAMIVAMFVAYFGLYLGARVISLAIFKSRQQIDTQPTKAKEADNGV